MWDESYLWGLIAYRALKKLSLDFSLVTSGDIKQGALEGRRLLYVPGGWASNKLEALGEDGARQIRRFVEGGGSYIGVCGGAGLATSEGIGLLDIKRRPLDKRVPSLSGKVRVKMGSPHPFWDGIGGRDKNKKQNPVFHIWWPSQFKPEGPSIKVVASFGQATPEAFSSDLNVGCISDWGVLESEYKINLDPGKMLDEPLALEGAYGAGRVFLTLIHLDTPGDPNGEKALQNIWKHLGGEKTERVKSPETPHKPAGGLFPPSLSKGLLAPVEELFDTGAKNFLWFRDGWTVRWRRGVRGLEYFTLHELVKELAQRVKNPAPPGVRREELEALIDGLRVFAQKAGRLLLLERLALQRGHSITFSKASDPHMCSLREELFASAKSHGGEFKKLLGQADGILYKYLRPEWS